MPRVVATWDGRELQVATEWLFSIPEDALLKHLTTDPNSPTSEEAPTDDLRVLVPRRVPLKVFPLASRMNFS